MKRRLLRATAAFALALMVLGFSFSPSQAGVGWAHRQLGSPSTLYQTEEAPMAADETQSTWYQLLLRALEHFLIF